MYTLIDYYLGLIINKSNKYFNVFPKNDGPMLWFGLKGSEVMDFLFTLLF